MQPRSRMLVVAVLAAAVAVAWLLLTSSEPPPTGRRLFGHWRLRDVAIASTAAWVALGACARMHSRRALFRVLLATLLAIATWALLELCGLLGLVDHGRLFGQVPRTALGHQALPNTVVRGVSYQDIGRSWGRDQPGIPFEYRTDRRGYRNEPDRAAGDVYLLGDSFVVAGLVPFGRTMTAGLERHLGAAVVNVALIGLGAQEERDLLLASGLPLAGRLVVQFVTEGNDLVDSARYRQGNPPPPRRSFTYHAVKWLERLTQPVCGEARTNRGVIGGQEYLFLWDSFSFRGLEGEIPHVLDALGELHAHVEGAGGTHVLVLIPSKLRVLGPLCEWPEGSRLAEFEQHLPPLRSALHDFCAQRRIELLDLTAILQQAAAHGAIPWFTHDSHWNEVGHELVARALGEWEAVRSWSRNR